MGSSPYATLRPVFVDGSLRARIEGAPVDIVISADGRNAVVTHVGGRRETESVTRVSLDDGHTERCASGATFGRRDPRWLISAEGLFEGVDTLRWSVRHAQHRGRGATYPRLARRARARLRAASVARRCARTPVGAALSPDGSRVAVRYGDGACEVFSIDRG